MFNLKNHLGVQLQLQGEGIPSYSVQHFSLISATDALSVVASFQQSGGTTIADSL